MRNHNKCEAHWDFWMPTETSNCRGHIFWNTIWKTWPQLLCLVPARGRVSPALRSQALLLSWGQSHCGSRVSFCYGHLFGLGSLFPTMGTVARIVDSRGTVLMETMRDTALRLTFHEVTLEKRRRKSFLKNSRVTFRKLDDVLLNYSDYTSKKKPRYGLVTNSRETKSSQNEQRPPKVTLLPPLLTSNPRNPDSWCLTTIKTL